ncbi:hypothetical protein SCLCIDRAFT_1207604 [Scleroderma citrinum Foug A]|uniref:Uncharacterized protein n=1 Tax=Scleroderma citrinum Foug A TaxID=1036808 RepID=A0A0C3ER36_9AGAM|nr:hypothetical protein SCLCIDRAFT_1207604 [Scleroderma citrinum Foug A]
MSGKANTDGRWCRRRSMRTCAWCRTATIEDPEPKHEKLVSPMLQMRKCDYYQRNPMSNLMPAVGHIIGNKRVSSCPPHGMVYLHGPS